MQPTVAPSAIRRAAPAYATGTLPSRYRRQQLRRSLRDRYPQHFTATDHTGAASARFADDPIGKAGSRCPTGARDAAGSLVINWEPILDRGTDLGFTGHEQLDDIGLVQMNRNRRICDAGLVRLRFL